MPGLWTGYAPPFQIRPAETMASAAMNVVGDSDTAKPRHSNEHQFAATPSIPTRQRQRRGPIPAEAKIRLPCPKREWSPPADGARLCRRPAADALLARRSFERIKPIEWRTLRLAFSIVALRRRGPPGHRPTLRPTHLRDYRSPPGCLEFSHRRGNRDTF